MISLTITYENGEKSDVIDMNEDEFRYWFEYLRPDNHVVAFYVQCN